MTIQVTKRCIRYMILGLVTETMDTANNEPRRERCLVSHREDDEVVRGARQGDESAWAVLYGQHAGRLVVWLRTLPSGDSSQAPEDVAADAWLTAAQELSKFTGNADDFAGWLFSIARNVASNRRRTYVRRATTPHPTGDPDMLGGDASYDQTAAVDSYEWTRRLLSRLSPREAEVIACIDVVGLDAAATGEALGISAATVRVARHRGLRRLRKILTEEDETAGSFAGSAPTARSATAANVSPGCNEPAGSRPD